MTFRCSISSFLFSVFKKCLIWLRFKLYVYDNVCRYQAMPTGFFIFVATVICSVIVLTSSSILLLWFILIVNIRSLSVCI